jgi:hypothetical protein
MLPRGAEERRALRPRRAPDPATRRAERSRREVREEEAPGRAKEQPGREAARARSKLEERGGAGRQMRDEEPFAKRAPKATARSPGVASPFALGLLVEGPTDVTPPR